MDINVFFSREKDAEINNRFIRSGVARDTAEVSQYVNDIISTPYRRFIDFVLRTNELPYVLSSDVPQFSSIDAATNKFCSLLSKLEPRGFTFEEIGKILQPGRTEDVFANKKYGENHVKTAEQLGLALFVDHKYYLSAIGYIFPMLSEYKRDQLLSRLALRNSLVYNIFFKALNGQNVSVAEEISFLSESTVKRRKNNALIVCRLIGLNKDTPVQGYLDRIN